MADDIVTRLREWAEFAEQYVKGADHMILIIKDAANEIERLRAENNYLVNCLERAASSIGETLKAHDAWEEARRG